MDGAFDLMTIEGALGMISKPRAEAVELEAQAADQSVTVMKAERPGRPDRAPNPQPELPLWPPAPRSDPPGRRSNSPPLLELQAVELPPATLGNAIADGDGSDGVSASDPDGGVRLCSACLAKLRDKIAPLIEDLLSEGRKNVPTRSPVLERHLIESGILPENKRYLKWKEKHGGRTAEEKLSELMRDAEIASQRR